MRMPDGTVITSESKTPPILPMNRSLQFNKPMTMKCQILEVLYINDPRNNSSTSQYPQVQYSVLVLDGHGQGNIINNVVDISQSGGVNNYEETIRNPSTNYQPSVIGIQDPRLNDGDYVIVENGDSYLNNPRIVAGFKHPLQKSTATSANGVTSTKVINGLKQSIDQNGALTIENMGGPVDAQGNPTNPSAAGSSITMNADGSMAMTRNNQVISIDKDGQITLTGPSGSNLNFATGGQGSMSSQNMNLTTQGVFNVKSPTTSIGQSPIPSARLSDIIVGTDSSGGPVIGSIQGGSFSTVIGS